MKIQFLTTLIAALIARNDELPEKKQRKCETVEYRKNCFKKKKYEDWNKCECTDYCTDKRKMKKCKSANQHDPSKCLCDENNKPLHPDPRTYSDDSYPINPDGNFYNL